MKTPFNWIKATRESQTFLGYDLDKYHDVSENQILSIVTGRSAPVPLEETSLRQLTKSFKAADIDANKLMSG